MRWLVLAFVLTACGGDERAEDDTETAAEETEVAADVAETDTAPDPRTCQTVPDHGVYQWDDALGTARVDVTGQACARTYAITSDAPRRDDQPPSPRVVTEGASDPLLRSGNPLVDALYALALTEARLNAVDEVRDAQMTGNQPVACPAPGCWVTGEQWSYVWTRDTAYAIELGLGAIDPERAAASLLFKLSDRRNAGGNPGTQIVQDTGSGGSYPVSSDRVVWALGAREVLANLDGEARTAFRDKAWVALRNTIEHDRRVVFDDSVGLYRGEQSFLDWREQSYPAHTATDVVDIADGMALSTNMLHLAAIELTAQLAQELGETTARERYVGWATDLRDDIRRFELQDADHFSTLLPTTLDRLPVSRYDQLGASLVILGDVASQHEAYTQLYRYPHVDDRAAPVIWPQQQLTPVYHNRAEWPFVSAYWLRAARKAGHSGINHRMVRTLIRGAALNLSHMENLEIASGAAWVDDGAYSGPVLNSRRQLWSIGGYLGMVHKVLFGLEATSSGLRVAPGIVPETYAELFGGGQMILNDYPYRGRRITVVLTVPEVYGHLRTSSFAVAERLLNGSPVGETILADVIADGAVLEVRLTFVPSTTPERFHDVPDVSTVNGADWRKLFGARTPGLTVERTGESARLLLAVDPSEAEEVSLIVYRDGLRFAELPGTTTTVDDPSEVEHCYTVEAHFNAGPSSQRSRAVCSWLPVSIQTIGADAFEAVGGEPVTQHGRFHHQAWGDPGDSLTVSDFRPHRSGRHLLQVEYGNGAGSIASGITCGVKRVIVTEEGGAVVGDGMLVMPQLATWERWAYSTFVSAQLDIAKTYRIAIVADPLAINMSSFELFARYAGTGGAAPFDHVNISELRVLAR